MKRIIGLNDNLEDLADKVLLDASAILPSLRSRRSLRKSDLRKRHKASKKLIGRLLGTNTRKGTCYATPLGTKYMATLWTLETFPQRNTKN